MCNLSPMLMIIMEHFCQDMFIERINIIWEWYSVSSNHFQICLHLHTLITSFSNQHFIENNTQRPYIAFLGIEVIYVSFRGHIFWWSYVVIHLRFVWDFVFFAITEIDYCYLLADFWFYSKKNIIRLKISMNNTFAADVTVCL